MAGSRILNAAFKLSTASFCNRHPVTAAQDPGLAGTTMAFQVNLPNEEAWAKEIAGSQSGVVQVIEVYQDWCGPCKAVVSTLKKQFFELGERPLKFYTANCKHIKALEKFAGHCEPVFTFYQDGKCLKAVIGVNAPVLSTTVDKLSAEAAAAVAAKA